MTGLSEPIPLGSSIDADPQQRGGRLRPSTLAIIKEALWHGLKSEPDFMWRFFPEVVTRKHPTLGDVLALTDLQADALRPLISDSIRYFWKQDGKEKNRGLNPFTRRPENHAVAPEFAKRALAWTEALRDLCSVFELTCPV